MMIPGKRRRLGANKGNIRSSTLTYLQVKMEQETALRNRELDLAEKRLELERKEREQNLQLTNFLIERLSK